MLYIYICIIYISWILLPRQPILDDLIYKQWTRFMVNCSTSHKDMSSNCNGQTSPRFVTTRYFVKALPIGMVCNFGAGHSLYTEFCIISYNVANWVRERWDTLTLVKSWESKVLNCMIQLIVYIFKKYIYALPTNNELSWWALDITAVQKYWISITHPSILGRW